MDKPSELELMIAKAINGPWNLNMIFDKPNDQRYTLEEIRDVKWGQLSSQEQGLRLVEAKSVIKTLTDEGKLLP